MYYVQLLLKVKTMEYKTRVIQEKEDLDQKIEKLKNFINSNEFHIVSTNEKDLLIRQLNTMTDYSAILVERIALHSQ